MAKPKVTTDTVKVSRLGCMRKSTVVSSGDGNPVEHIEVWVPGDGVSRKPDSDVKKTTTPKK